MISHLDLIPLSFHEIFPIHTFNLQTKRKGDRLHQEFLMQLQKGFDLIPKCFDNLNEKKCYIPLMATRIFHP